MEVENRARFLHVQLERIKYDKWCEGCGSKQDPGREYVMQWIDNYAGMFRLAWDNSLCKCCKHARRCGYYVKQECGAFEKMQKPKI